MSNAGRKRRRVPRVLFAVVAPLQAFFRTQAASGVVLLLATAAALTWANSPGEHLYHALLDMPVEVRISQWGLAWPLHHWINDALMAVFFLVAGMEIKHAITVGELRSIRQALLPLVAAAGGMLVPALIFLGINGHGESRQGWGIPMATDIAFAVGCLSLIRSRIPSGLFIFLTALAIFDDLGAIIVIALFYGGSVNTPALALAGALTMGLVVMSRWGVQRLWPYLLVGVALWGATLASGVHATLAGVVLGLTLPAQSAREPGEVLDDLDRALQSLRRACANPPFEHASLSAMEKHVEAMQSPLMRLLHVLEKPVAFGIVPLFALANAGVTLGKDSLGLLFSRVSLGVLFGLFVGKTVGVFGATYLAVKLKIADRPAQARWLSIFGVSIMAGIGFTMSLFITMLAFSGHPMLVDEAKVGILGGSFIAATVGLVLLRTTSEPIRAGERADDSFAVLLELPRIAPGFALRPWTPEGSFVGLTLGEANVRQRYGVTVLGVWRNVTEGEAMRRPVELVGPDYRIRAEDTLLLAGEEAAVERLVESATPASPERRSKSGELLASA